MKPKELTFTEFMTFLAKHRCREEYIRNTKAYEGCLHKFWNDMEFLPTKIIIGAFLWEDDRFMYWNDLHYEYLDFVKANNYTKLKNLFDLFGCFKHCLYLCSRKQNKTIHERKEISNNLQNGLIQCVSACRVQFSYRD